MAQPIYHKMAELPDERERQLQRAILLLHQHLFSLRQRLIEDDRQIDLHITRNPNFEEEFGLEVADAPSDAAKVDQRRRSWLTRDLTSAELAELVHLERNAVGIMAP